MDNNVVIETKVKYYAGKNISQSDRCDGTVNVYETLWKKQFTDSRTKVSRKDWKLLVKSGRNATNSYSRSGYDLVTKPGTYIITNPAACEPKRPLLQKFVGTSTAGSIPTSLTLPVISHGSEQLARSRFMSSIKQAQNHISGPVFLGELRKSLQMIHRPASALKVLLKSYMDDIHALGRINRRGLKEDALNQDLHRIWLEYALGWAPLISETKKGAEALSRLINGDRKTFQVSGGATDKTKKVTVTNDAISTIAYAVAVNTDESQAFVGLKGAVRPVAKGPVFRSMDLFGFNAKEFVPTIWELLPMSFVVDYFVNVGDILSATYTDTTGLYWVSEQRGMVYTRSKDSSKIVNRPNQVSSVSGSAGSWTLKRYTYSRSHPDTIFPSLAVSLPGQPTQLLNIAALTLSAKNASTKLSRLIK